MIDLKGMPEKKLLSLRLKDLEISFSDLPYRDEINIVEKELMAKKVDFRAHYWIGDEWYSPDGITGISIPFYLCHKKLIALEKKMIGYAEGSTRNEFKKYLRHEYAHAIDNGHGLRRSKKRQKLFGLASRPYPETYDYDPESQDYVVHLAPYYAQAHPEEDWAETFAVWLAGKKRGHSSGLAFDKLMLVDEILSQLNKKAKYNSTVTDPISENELTLREYYNQKQSMHFHYGPFYLKKKLEGHLTSKTKRVNAFNFVRKKKREILKRLNSHYSLKQSERFYNDIEIALKKDKQFFNNSDKDLVTLLISTTIKYVQQGHHRIVM